MVLDRQTLSSLYDMANVVREYIFPGRSRVELTDQQKQDGCMLRYLHGWHVNHIVEALGVANSNYSHNWEDNMLEALEECALSDYWNTQQIRLSPGAQISKEGTNQYGAARFSALRNAIAQVLISDPTVPSTSLMDKAFAVIDRQINDGSYRNARPRQPGRQNLNRYIRDMAELGFVWEGAGRTQIMADLPQETREAIDNEILRQCRLQVAEGATIVRQGRERQAAINYSAIARDIYSNFIINEQFQDTMEKMSLERIQPAYVRGLCQDAGITVDVRRPVADQVADEANIKLVTDERKKDPRSTSWQIHQRTGLRLPIVQQILDAQGLTREGRAYTVTEMRQKLLAAHDDEKLTPEGMLEKYPEIAEYYKDNVNTPADAIRQLLRRAGRTPLTATILEAQATDERRIPARAGQLKSVFLAYLRSRDQEWLDRVRGNLTRTSVDYAEETGYTIDSLAEVLEETPEFVERVIALIESESPQLIANREGDIVIPRSGLQWIVRGGTTVEGEEG